MEILRLLILMIGMIVVEKATLLIDKGYYLFIV